MVCPMSPNATAITLLFEGKMQPTNFPRTVGSIKTSLSYTFPCYSRPYSWGVGKGIVTND